MNHEPAAPDQTLVRPMSAYLAAPYEFTPAEQAAIERAASEHLSPYLTDHDAEEVAYNIASAIRSALVTGALAAYGDELADALPSLDTRNRT